MMTDAFDPDFASPADWVIAYRALLLNVIPATEKKHPVVNWREFQQGLVPAAVFDRWYGPDGEYSRSYSMGFLTGPASLPEGEALLGIDCDAKEIDGRLTWQGWLDVHENGLEPETWKARTGSGGRHIFFRYPSSITIRNAQGKYRGIDVRAEGGFIMAAPSAHYIRGTHYEWEEGCDPLQGAHLADAPPWLIQMCQDMQEAPRAEAGERVEASGSYDAWGNRTDGREAYMRDVVWASVLDLYRACPIRPGEDESLAAMQRAYEAYARNVRSRFPGDNEVGLEREGRGLSLFQVKWDMAMRQWDRKVAEEAARPRKEEPKPQAEKPKTRIEIVPWDDLPDVKVKWLVEGFLPAGGYGALYGKPGSYKSFVALYIAACIGGQMDAFGRTTGHGDVVYIAGEGGAGLKARRDAFMKKYDMPPGTRVHFIRAQLNLRSGQDDAQAVVEAVEALGIKPVAIIIDTLARAFAGGNENASEDMGAFIGVTGWMQERLGRPAILLVHHSGKDEARGMRGHSALLGAVDTELEVVKLSAEDSPDRVGQMTVTKQKDGEDGYAISYRLELVPLSPITGEGSLVVVPDEEVKAAGRGGRKNLLKGDKRLVFEAIKMAVEEAGQTVPNDKIPRSVMCARLDLARRNFYAMTERSQAAGQKAFSRNINELQENRTIAIWADWVWIVHPDNFSDTNCPA